MPPVANKQDMHRAWRQILCNLWLPNPQPAVASEARRKRKAAMALKIGEPNNASSASRRSTRSRISLGRENTAEQEKQGYAQTSQIIAPTHNEAEDPTLRRPNRHRPIAKLSN